MSKPTVEVTRRCERTDKDEKVAVPLDEAEALYQNVALKQGTAEKLRKEFASVDPAKMPDLMVYYRGKLCVLSTVGTKQDNFIIRHLSEVTNKPDIFPKLEPEIKRPRKNAVKGNPTESDSE